MKIVNDLTRLNEVKDKAFPKDHEHAMDMSALFPIVTVVLIFIPLLNTFFNHVLQKEVIIRHQHLIRIDKPQSLYDCAVNYMLIFTQ